MTVLKPQRSAERGVGGRWLPGAVPAGARPWQPGVSANPGGKGGLYQETLKLAREASPDAMRRLIQLSGSEDERVAAVACSAVLDRAWGKVREFDPKSLEETKAPRFDPSKLSAEQLAKVKDALLLMVQSGTSEPVGDCSAEQ